jgi:HSP20 family molecular chaperone IbpA
MKDNKNKSLEKYQEGAAETTRDEPVFLPNTDIYEKDDAILVRCDMPGVDQSGVDITLENHELVITGHQSATRPEGFDLLSGEYDSGTFERTFRIPQLIDHDHIKASLQNGVLDIELPKSERAKPRKIAITTGN